MASNRYETALIVGAGAMAVDHHLPRFFTHLGVARVDTFESDPRRRSHLAHRFRRNQKIKIIEEIPGDTRYDLVLIATPPKFHHEFYTKLERQAPAFLIEKPLAMNATEAAIIEKSAAQFDVKVFVNLIRRTLENFKLLRRFHETGQFGQLEEVSVAEGGVFSWRAVSLGSFSKELNGGGVLMDTGPHTLDLLLQVFDDLELESAHMDAAQGAIEANCTLRLIADGSIPITVLLSRNRHLSNRACFRFARATCTASVLDNSIVVNHANGTEYEMFPAGHVPIAPLTFADLNDAFYRRFLVSGDNSTVGPSQAGRALRLIDKAYEVAAPIHGGF